MSSASNKRVYRNRLKRSLCKKGKKNATKCKRIRGCKPASGTKRKFCRKIHNITAKKNK
jgi:hypothetical protein